ncbi:MAG: hypothetical protein WDN28_20685 [Chthoniobacter sp.]
MQDAQRAIGLIRHHAAEWGIARTGLLGFSAGGNLTGHEAFDRTARTYPQKPESDTDARPDFIVLIYGGGFLDPADKTKSAPASASPPTPRPPSSSSPTTTRPTPSRPPCSTSPTAAKHPRRAAHLHPRRPRLRMRKDGHPINEWPDRCADWMRAMGYLSAAGNTEPTSHPTSAKP